MLTRNQSRTRVRRLDIRTKIIGFCGLTILTFLFNDPFYNLFLALLLCPLVWSSGLTVKRIRSLLTPLIPLMIFIMIFTGCLTPPERFELAVNRTVLVNIMPHIHLYRGGILLGLTYLIRILLIIISSSLLLLISPLEEFIELLQKVHVSYEITFLITTAIRFIPTMEREKNLIMDAQKARGAHLDSRNLIGGFKAQIPVMIPLIVNSILMADRLSIAMLNRGFGYAGTWTSIHELTFTTKDYWAIFMILSVVCTGIFMRIYWHLGNL